MAVDSDEPVIGNSEVKKLEDRVLELERILGRETLENEIPREVLPKPTRSEAVISGGRKQSSLPQQVGSPPPV